MMSWKELIEKVNQSPHYEAVWTQHKLRRKSLKDGGPVMAPRLTIRTKGQPCSRVVYKKNVKIGRTEFVEKLVAPAIVDQFRKLHLSV